MIARTLSFLAASFLVTIACDFTGPKPDKLIVSVRTTTLTAPATVVFDVHNPSDQAGVLDRCNYYLSALEVLRSQAWTGYSSDTCADSLNLSVTVLKQGATATGSIVIAEHGIYRVVIAYGLGPIRVLREAVSAPITVGLTAPE